MGRPFKGRGDGVEVGLDDGERELLVHLLGQLDELLDDGRPGFSDPLAELVGFDPPLDPAGAGAGAGPGAAGPQDEGAEAGQGDEGADPALARLLPDANRQDPQAAAEFRRLTEAGLRSRKRAGARQAAQALGRDGDRGRLVLDGEEAGALLTALTDLRLVLAERLDLHTDEDADRLHRQLRERMARPSDGADPWAATAAVYDLLTWWQEALVGVLTSRSQRRRC